MIKKQLTIAFTVSLAVFFLGTTNAVRIRQVEAPTLSAAVEAAPVLEAPQTQDV